MIQVSRVSGTVRFWRLSIVFVKKKRTVGTKASSDGMAGPSRYDLTHSRRLQRSVIRIVLLEGRPGLTQ